MFWLIRQGESPPLGYDRTRRITGGFAFGVYVHCRDAAGRPPAVAADCIDPEQ
ncbi:hypothetical protein [Frigoribacterium sp. CFBP 13707]|uniref:hypothetical protein n=1 Tax=Frigoribacterium sp. CFBP 13707 TaxID=2775313 RepID=UPI00177F321E|nr:hypothetical protein [Frigoribacterium sp. CFBP 13707]MBD8728259.1 hypothetical protein [Frigoribacterium sp. CFBP 13707]